MNDSLGTFQKGGAMVLTLKAVLKTAWRCSWLVLCLISTLALAEDTVVELADMKMEDLMKMTIASRTPLTERESPGIVSVVTRQEILDSGARDLIDVLRLIPGFQFAADYNGTIGVGVRGLWGLEGKVLFMLDGQSLSDLYYNSVLFGDRFPLDQISRIEIIRGPGSAIYGNQAEYAVVNIITQTGEEMGGGQAKVTYGHFAASTARTQVSLAYGKKFGENPDDLDLSIKTYLALSQRSDRNLLYPTGDLYSMYDAYKTTPQHINIGAKYKKFTARFIVDRVSQFARDVIDTSVTPNVPVTLSGPSEFRFDNYTASLKYDWELSPQVTLTPEYSFQFSYPYYNQDPNVANTDGFFDIFVMRHKITLPVTYVPFEKLNLVGGVDSYWDIGGAGPVNGYYDVNTSTVTSKSSYFNNVALFGQGIYSSSLANVTLGARLENHSIFGTSFVPRFGLTKILEPWHFKFLFSRAFRYPSIGNINDAASAGATVEPERTQIFEFETGYHFNPNHSLVLNLFNISVDKPIVYLAATRSYGNFDTTGSRGAELVYKVSGKWGYSQLSYGFYDSIGFVQVPKFVVSQDSTQLAGFAPHKIAWNTHLNITRSFKINPQLLWLSAKYSYGTPFDSSSRLTTSPMDPVFLTNLYFSYSDLFIKNLDLGFGIFDLFGSNFSFPTAYDLSRNPMPGPSREYVLSAAYRIGL